MRVHIGDSSAMSSFDVLPRDDAASQDDGCAMPAALRERCRLATLSPSPSAMPECVPALLRSVRECTHTDADETALLLALMPPSASIGLADGLGRSTAHPLVALVAATRGTVSRSGALGARDTWKLSDGARLRVEAHITRAVAAAELLSKVFHITK